MSIVSTRQRSIRRAIRARSRDPGTPAPKPGRGPSRRLGMAVARLAGLVRSRRARRSRWARHGVLVGGLTLVLILVLPIVGLAHHLYFDESDLPDIEPFIRFELPTTGQVYDARGGGLIPLAPQYPRGGAYDEGSLILREGILATPGKKFFSHDGVE